MLDLVQLYAKTSHFTFNMVIYSNANVVNGLKMKYYTQNWNKEGIQYRW